MSKILVVDDDRIICKLVESSLTQDSQYSVVMAHSGRQGLEYFGQHAPDAVLLDLHLPESHGFELFRSMLTIDSRVPIIFITADSSSDVVIQAMRIGAFDYLKKPLHVDRLRQMVASAVAARKAADAPVALSVDGASDNQYFIGSSPAMLEVFKSIGRVARQRIPVLIRGESGSGKELVARAIVEHSGRADKPFMSINCAAIPDALLESELFGHEKGAFTGADKRRIGRFEQCDGGTLFLDEIGDMSPLIQGKVLRLLQEQEFERVGGTDVIRTDVRIIAATHQPLEKMVETGEFRQDLLFRLNGFTIQLPPLRDRPSDVPSLIEYFLRRAKTEMDRPELVGLSQDAVDGLTQYTWPGNVRELQSVLRQSLMNCVGTVITRDCLPEPLHELLGSAPESMNSKVSVDKSQEHSGEPTNHPDSPVRPESNSHPVSTLETEPNRLVQPAAASSLANDLSDAIANGSFPLDHFIRQRFDSGSTDIYAEVISEVERRMMSLILQLTDGNQSRASEVLGITRGKVRDRIAAYHIKLDTTVTID